MKKMLLYVLCALFSVPAALLPREKKVLVRREIVNYLDRTSKVLPRDYLEMVFTSPVLQIDTVMLRDLKEKKHDLKTFLDSLYSPASVARGKRFLAEYKNTLVDVKREYGPPPAITTSIIRVESDLGRNLGKYLAMNVYYTLYAQVYGSWKRREGVLRQLKVYLEVCYQNNLSPYLVTSSWAGAIGYCQFMPASFGLAMDGDGDGMINITGSMPDAIASAAHFLAVNGYRRNPRQAVLRYIGGTMRTSGWYVNAVFTYAKLISE